MLGRTTAHLHHLSVRLTAVVLAAGMVAARQAVDPTSQVLVLLAAAVVQITAEAQQVFQAKATLAVTAQEQEQTQRAAEAAVLVVQVQLVQAPQVAQAAQPAQITTRVALSHTLVAVVAGVQEQAGQAELTLPTVLLAELLLRLPLIVVAVVAEPTLKRQPQATVAQVK